MPQTFIHKYLCAVLQDFIHMYFFTCCLRNSLIKIHTLCFRSSFMNMSSGSSFMNISTFCSRHSFISMLTLCLRLSFMIFFLFCTQGIHSQMPLRCVTGIHSWTALRSRYWYRNSCLYPDMGSVFIPVDDCTRENSCLQVLKGSHRLGRIDHSMVGEQLGADIERVEEVRERESTFLWVSSKRFCYLQNIAISVMQPIASSVFKISRRKLGANPTFLSLTSLETKAGNPIHSY